VAEESFDVVVVGAGAGGSFAAMKLAQTGLRVLLLERGGWYNARDYPMRYSDWERHFPPFAPRQEFTVALLPTQTLQQQRYALFSHAAGSHKIQRKRDFFHYSRAHGIGGSTLHYQGEAHRFPGHAFRSHSLFGLGDQDWPFGYAELAPYYTRIESILGVAGQLGNPFKEERGPFPTPAHTLTPASEWIKRGADVLGWQLLPNTLALPTRSVDGRSPCQRSGGCVQGCIFGAKSSADLVAIPRGLKTGNLVVRPKAKVLKLQTRKGRITTIEYSYQGKAHHVLGQTVVLALGAVETPRLLLNSNNRDYPEGLGNTHDQVGRYFMATVMVEQHVRLDSCVRAWDGPPIDSRIWNFNRPGAVAGLQSGCVLGVSGTMSGFHGPVSYARASPGFGLAHKQAMRREFGSIATIFGIAEQEPRKENRIVLAKQKDLDGMPMVHVKLVDSERDKQVIEFMADRTLELAKAAKVRELLHKTSSYDRPNAAHVAGSCRMGLDARTSVVNEYGKVHDVENLFITDASVLVTQGAGDSPSLTIQSLALRTAEHIAGII